MQSIISKTVWVVPHNRGYAVKNSEGLIIAWNKYKATAANIAMTDFVPGFIAVWVGPKRRPKEETSDV